MKELNEILDTIFVDNTIRQYCWFALIIIMGVIFKRFISKLSSRLMFRFFKKYSAEISIGKFFEYLHKPTSLFFLLVFVYIGFSQLRFPEYWHLAPDNEFGIRMIIEKSFLILVISSLIWICLRIVDVFGFIMVKRAEKAPGKTGNQIIPFMIEVLKVVVIIIGVFLILGTVFNLNIGTLITGLGIGGLAVALAAKETLENFLGSFTIFLDKPFAIGDFVKVGDVSGVVEKIGFRSTRLRTIEQSCVSIPNKKMVNAELDNLSLRTQQRVNFTLSLRYDTSSEQIKYILDDIRNLLNNHSMCGADNVVRLTGFGVNAYEILIIYFVNTADYFKYLEIKEEINFNILDIVKQHKATFACVTTTVYVEK